LVFQSKSCRIRTLRRTQTRRRSNEPQVRLQLGATGGPVSVAANIIKNEGFGTLYTGLSAGLLRQATYTTARLGIHAKIVDFLKEQNKGAPLPLVQKAGAGLAAGGLGAIFGSPADLSLIRMQADGTLPAAERRNYTGVGHALTDIVKKEGVGGLFVGASTTAVRAMALNMGMLASNDQAKEMMKDNGITGFPGHARRFRHRRILRVVLFAPLRLRQDAVTEAEAPSRRHAAVPRIRRLRGEDHGGRGTAQVLHRLPHVLRAHRAARHVHPHHPRPDQRHAESDGRVRQARKREGVFGRMRRKAPERAASAAAP
jgi:hypothetical protein